jgi:serine/threonine protein kinase
VTQRPPYRTNPGFATSQPSSQPQPQAATPAAAPITLQPGSQPVLPPPPSRSLYETGPIPPPPPQHFAPPSAPLVHFPQIGTTLTSARGAYVVRSVIGAGEFGAVYESIGPFDQVYALKMVRPANRPYAEVQGEWAREVQRLMSLRHPNVVYIYDAFVGGHLFYLALERCDHPLTAMLGTPMQEGLVIELARQLLAAVQFLHDNDIVHDDLHPGNVLITHADRPIVKISDFGISHELRGLPAIRPNVVHHAIMAPEILASGYTSKQSDLYQVGLLLYWMLMGTPAILTDAPYAELVRQVADGDPRRRAEAIGTPLGGLIAKMLRRREAYRYLAAREVWADLRELPAWKERQLFPAK